MLDKVCVPMSSLGEAGPCCSFLREEAGGEKEKEKPRGRSWKCLGLGKIQRPLRERMRNSPKGK